MIKIKFYEDINVNEQFVTPARTITEADVVLFAAITGDYNSIHTDEVYSKKFSIYGRRVVHGLFVLSIAEGLFQRLGWFEGVPAVSIGYEDVRFIKSVFIGDTIHFVGEVIDKRISKKREKWGIVKIKMEGKNVNDNTTVISFIHAYLVPLKNGEMKSNEKA
ncbi:MaoC domain protein dehydratase [Sulfolobus islandicus Y.N.15.51]|uniref:MaoC domain protein dehydratase n=1 Tax=Saccharolobus islandicus (strain Y.N.15.51 / Yellowstone \|nr:MaoC/PaaZ C-terminal domain-containing protein [Sulfolobus islandicus]ACP49116.1 MaoC domain protein dehydratase [Sulfolobus islandicus Y.N.15.51]